MTAARFTKAQGPEADARFWAQWDPWTNKVFCRHRGCGRLTAWTDVNGPQTDPCGH